MFSVHVFFDIIYDLLDYYLYKKCNKIKIYLRKTSRNITHVNPVYTMYILLKLIFIIVS